MPHATDDADEDERLFNAVLSGDPDQLSRLQDINDRDLEEEEKANDAENFEDIGDDDLADDDDDNVAQAIVDGTNNLASEEPNVDDLFGAEPAETADEDPFDDLFNAPDPSSPTVTQPDESTAVSEPRRQRDSRELSADSVTADDVAQKEGDIQEESEVEEPEDAETREQRLLFEQARLEREERLRHGGEDIPPAPQTDAELFATIFPQYEKKKPLRWSHLQPQKKATYLDKAPLKPPKPVHPTKVNLELQQDQEKNFRLPGPATGSFASRHLDAEGLGITLVAELEPQKQEQDDDDHESLASVESGDLDMYKWEDLVALCEDWELPEVSSDIDLEPPQPVKPADDDDDLFMDLESIAEEHGSKARKITDHHGEPLRVLHEVQSRFENPESETARLAKRIRLDLNDPYMLVDIRPKDTQTGQKRTFGAAFSRDVAGGLTKTLAKRYNVSNDDAYDLLKENRQSKIRSTLGNLAVEHALPAVKLQYPFYKVKLSAREARSFHRPTLNVEPGLVTFDKPKHIKRKHLKGRSAQSIFERSEDLSHGDNSSVLLLEYSEEYPAMMSSFGMGSRLINYYRRIDDQDTSRPKFDIGETDVLLPQDKSPFSIFGDVDPGQTTPTIQNSMYRAPVFKHEPSHQDFMVVSNRTGINGRKWFLKNIENVHVVGQEFPSVEVPGQHSRKVTDASKKRLRMVSYRMLRKHKRLKNEMILDHLPGSDIAQNRSKMREFMVYDKERGWLPPSGTEVPDEPSIRAMIKPEDVCLLESMQVGDRQLHDAGYNKADDDSEQEEDDDKEGQTLEELLAPWQTTKNFLNACQGKAMLQLHGEGDPSGRGEAFSFIRTSMKGGFREIGESVEDKIDAKKQKELGGHSYNVAKQQRAYNDAIRRIWDAQRTSLASDMEYDDMDMDDEEQPADSSSRQRTPSSAVPGRQRQDDETGSMYSRTSTGSQQGKVLRITRTFKDKYGEDQTSTEIIRDPKVWREYMRRRRVAELNTLKIGDLRPTNNAERDADSRRVLETELARLQRNKERRQAREKAKGIVSADSPGSGGSPSGDGPDSGPGSSKKKNQTGGTQRKCANCGQVGHIKTNKKLCPMLNGTIKQDEGFGDSAFGSISAPTPGSAVASSPPGFGM